jgi:hypothetical protein
MFPEDLESGDVRARREDDGTFSATHENGRRASCDPDAQRCAPDDYTDDEVNDSGVPGTEDDLPYTLGEDRDPELWGQQRQLIREDEAEGLDLEGVSEERIGALLDAMGDDAAEVLQDSPNGTSATGADSPLDPEHGGFPER